MNNEPPRKFQIEIETNTFNKKNSCLCPLCRNNRNKLICSKCLSLGLFSFANSEERFVDKQEKLKNLKNAQLLLNDQYMKKFEILKKLENLRNGILKTRKRNALLVDLVKEKKDNIRKLQEIKKENHDKNRSMKIILPKYEDKVNKLGEYVMIAVEKNDNLRIKSQDQMEQLKKLRRSQVEKLIEYIFPISVKVSKNSFQHEIDTDTNAILPKDESLGSDYFTKEFVIANGPSIPSDGNYFVEYCKWLQYNNKNATAANSDDGMERLTHKAYSIVAALTYITQLIQTLSFYLDIRLPHKITCNDFCKVILNEQQFRKKVSKLNYNVAYFSYGYMTQNFPKYNNVYSSSIVENIQNILNVLNDRKECLEEASHSGADSISYSFTDLNETTSDSDDDDDVTQKDWENIPSNVDIMLAASSPQQAPPPEAISTAMSSTIMNNISNVAHSLFWNRWGGK